MVFKFKSLVPNDIYGRNVSIASHVFNMLRNAIVTLKLLPGDSLSEAEVAKQLGVSRQPVREAFIQLSKIGMLNIVPQKGSFVVKIAERDVENAQFIREAIEVAIVQRACTMATQAQIDNLNEVIAEQKSAAAKSDQEKFLELDDAFHLEIAKSVDCQYGWHIVENLKAQMDRVRFLSLPGATSIAKIVQQHQHIVQAIQNNDPLAAGTAMKTHLCELLDSLPRLAEHHKDMFIKDSGLFP
jgi:DNA-binding GntR family transcriptional regulator